MRVHLVAFYTFLRGEVGRGVLRSSPWDPVMGDVEMVQSCFRGGLDWT